jgi:acetate kinase
MDALLVVNAGSSSLKFCVYSIDEAPTPTLVSRGQIDGIGTRPRLRAHDGAGVTLTDQTFAPAEVADVAAAMDRVGAWLRQKYARTNLVAVGHRVAHGGARYAAPVIVDDTVLSALERFIPLAPLHQPHHLRPMRTLAERYPGVVQVACFDTGFHRGHPEVADRYALPDDLYKEGVRRYGFHGLSYEYIARRLPAVAPEIARGAVVVCHLGSGSSMCAIKDGRSVDSTMGFTALDGLPMGTRCGQLDPGVVLYLLAEKGYSVKDVEQLLYQRAGLRGLSGVSNDVRDLLASEDPRARPALDYLVYRVAREIGSLAAAMNGIDAVVFTAGIGENSPDIRARVCARSSWLGLEVDDAANRGGGPRISVPRAAVSAWVIPTDEEGMIAAHTLDSWRAHEERRPHARDGVPEPAA